MSIDDVLKTRKELGVGNYLGLGDVSKKKGPLEKISEVAQIGLGAVLLAGLICTVGTYNWIDGYLNRQKQYLQHRGRIEDFMRHGIIGPEWRAAETGFEIALETWNPLFKTHVPGTTFHPGIDLRCMYNVSLTEEQLYAIIEKATTPEDLLKVLAENKISRDKSDAHHTHIESYERIGDKNHIRLAMNYHFNTYSQSVEPTLVIDVVFGKPKRTYESKVGETTCRKPRLVQVHF